MYVSVMFYCFYIDQIYKEYGLEFIQDDQFLTFIGAIGGLVSGISKLYSGYLMDQYRYKTIFSIITAIIFLHIATIQMTVKNKWSYFAAIMIIMSCAGSLISTMPVLILQIFGMKRGP